MTSNLRLRQNFGGTQVSAHLPGSKSRAVLEIVYRPLETLEADPSNPRVHSKKQLKQIAKSIEAFGFNVPVLIDPDRRIIAGHGRVEACKLLGIAEVPTVSLEPVLANGKSEIVR